MMGVCLCNNGRRSFDAEEMKIFCLGYMWLIIRKYCIIITEVVYYINWHIFERRKTMAVAKFLNELHVKKHGCAMDQMKMHKMMYFSQRESLMISSNPLFDEDFEAWKYGPVLVKVRNEYQTGHMFSGAYKMLTENEKVLVESVFDRYDEYDSWQLSTLSHAEHSWLQARKGLADGEAGKRKMSLSAMKADAIREFLRRKGVVLA